MSRASDPDRVRRRGACTLAILIAACGPKVNTGAWQEHEALGTSRAGAGQADPRTGGAPATPIDLSTLDARTIDELDEATALAALDQLGDRKPAARVALRAARLAHHRGDDADARAILVRVATAADEAEVHTELAALAKAAAEPPVDAKLVAVLLPLSGRFAGLGSELRAAIELAPGQGVTWLFLDTKGEPDGAAAAVETARQRGAIAILGPVGTREAIAAARAASLAQIPIALLAPDDGADPAAGVFRLVLSPADEGRAVARLAQADNFPTVGVFAPRDDVGQETAQAFVTEAKKLGLGVTGNGSYDPTGGNVEPDVKTFLNLIPATNPRLAEHLARNKKDGWKTFSPDVPFTLLYIPDRYDRAAIVAAFLPYFGVELRTLEMTNPDQLQRKHGGHMPQIVQLIGGAGWHHPSLPIRGGDAVQGALIVDVFAGALGGDLAGDFVAAFQQRTQRTPSGAAAEAHDAAILVAKAREAAAIAAEPRAAMRTALARGKLDDGVCGPAQMDVDGEIVRTPLLLEVQGDEMVAAP
jgi:ABC-type branched-subunit amino acid transport system substrate-binding protein